MIQVCRESKTTDGSIQREHYQWKQQQHSSLSQFTSKVEEPNTIQRILHN